MQKSLITIILDRSTSMASRAPQTVSALNEYVDSLREAPGDNRLSLVRFSSVGITPNLSMDKVFVAEDVKTVRRLDLSDMRCGGGTPLLAAIRQTVGAVSASIAGRSDVKPVIVIQTDGEENTSHLIRWTDEEGAERTGVSHDQVRSLIARKQAEGWEFVFMGCGIDAYQDGLRIGLGAGNVVSYGDDEARTRAVFRATAQNTSAYLSGATASMAYSAAQKRSAGDLFMEEDG